MLFSLLISTKINSNLLIKRRIKLTSLFNERRENHARLKVKRVRKLELIENSSRRLILSFDYHLY